MNIRLKKAWFCLIALLLCKWLGAEVLAATFNEPVVPGQLSIGRSTNGAAQITYRGQTNFPFVIRASTNLVNWSGLLTNMMSNAVPVFRDDAATNLSQRFYSATTLKAPWFFYGTNSGPEAGTFLLYIRTNNVGTLFAYNRARNRGEKIANMTFNAEGRYCGPIFSQATGCIQVGPTGLTGSYTNVSNQTGVFTGTNRLNYGLFAKAAGMYSGTFGGACPSTIEALLSADGAVQFYIYNAAGTYIDSWFGQVNPNTSFGDPAQSPDRVHISGTVSINLTPPKISGSYTHGCSDKIGAGPVSLNLTEKAF